jgi:hypothetical protein
MLGKEHHFMNGQKDMASLEHAYQDFTAIILSLSDEQFLSPMDGWAPRDVVAHLAGWNGLMIESSLAILAGKPPTCYADVQNNYSNINAGFTARYSSRSKQELLAELRSTMKEFEVFIDSLSAEDLAADHGVVHYSDSPATVGRIITSLAGDYRDHAHQMKERFYH